ncbi:MAG: hypothetical protein ACRC14_05940 [Paracoccaceae bacterium]
MPIILTVLILVAGFLWWSWGRDRAGSVVSNRLDRLFRRSACKWTPTGETNGRFHEYRCETCGIAAYSTTGSPPVTCKRNIRNG